MKQLRLGLLSLLVTSTAIFIYFNKAYSNCGTNSILIQPNSEITASIYNETDYYKIILPVEGILHVYATNIDSGNIAFTAGKIKNDSCVIIASDSGTFDCTDNNFTIKKNFKPGSYYIEVSRSEHANTMICERWYYLHADFTPLSSPLVPIINLLLKNKK